ncbi:MAG: hypothetical protein ACLQPH_21255 [Acidimicrobiales bacterium]
MLVVERDHPLGGREGAGDRQVPGPGVADGSRSFDGRNGGRPALGASTPRRHRGWQPLAGDQLLERLRVTGRPRPTADPELAHRLRRGIEHDLTLGGGPTGRRPAPTVVVTKDRLRRALACGAHHPMGEFDEPQPTTALACGALVDVLFRQLVTVGSFDDPMADGLAALAIDDRNQRLVSWIETLPAPARRELAAEVERQADGLRRRWPGLEPSWLPRTQEALRAELAGGAVSLSARVDLAIGGPAEGEASVAFVEVTSGMRRAEHRADLHFYALVETLRRSVPPFVVATYYTRTGELDVDPVTEELLVSAARRTRAGVRTLWEPANGVHRSGGR